MMLLFAGFAPLVVLATGVAADFPLARDSLITVPISKRIDFNGIPDFIKRDREHLRDLVKRGGHRRQFSTANKTPSILLNNTGGIYVATIGIGEPATNYRLLVDSGSAMTWVGADKHRDYVKTKNSVNTKMSVNITYDNGFFNGLLYNDTVTISEGINITQQYIGVSLNSSGFSPLDGVLGIGPNDLTLGILSNDKMIARTITDTLFHQEKIQKNQVAVSFSPTNSFPTVNGELTFGGIDSTKFIGALDYFALAKSSPAKTFWSVDAALEYLDGNTTILKSGPGVFDTGTTLFGLATDTYTQYVKATGAVFDETVGLLSITLDQYKKLQSFFFKIEHNTYEFNANAQIWPRALNQLIGGKKELVYLIVSDLGPDLSNEMGFLFGMTFLERFYVVFDSRRHRVGLANTQFTNSMTAN